MLEGQWEFGMVGCWWEGGRLECRWECGRLVVWSVSGSLVGCWFGVTVGVWYVAGLE
jgi:hypothetical protein